MALIHSTKTQSGDGLTDGDEINIYKTNPRLADTDGDGLTDGDEINMYKTTQDWRTRTVTA